MILNLEAAVGAFMQFFRSAISVFIKVMAFSVHPKKIISKIFFFIWQCKNGQICDKTMSHVHLLVEGNLYCNLTTIGINTIKHFYELHRNYANKMST